MAYIAFQPHDHFDTPSWTGSNSTTTINGMAFKPDSILIKRYDGSGHPVWNDSSGGTARNWIPSGSNAVNTTVHVASYTADGFTLTGNVNDTNDASQKYIATCWKGGGDAPAITYVVKVVSDTGNKYRFDDFGTSTVAIQLQEGGTYTFDQADSSNNGHPLRFSTTANGSHGGGSEYTTGVTASGTPGNAGAKTVIVVAASAPTLYYYCTAHSGMGGTANTNSTRGSSNLKGSIHSQVSVDTTGGFSVVEYIGTGANGTIGHGLSQAPKIIIAKNTTETDRGIVLNMGNTYVSDPATDIHQFALNSSQVDDNAGGWNDTAPTSTVFTIGSLALHNGDSDACIAYCWHEVQGHSKFGYYSGNGQVCGTTIYCGFRPKWFLIKKDSSAENWVGKFYDIDTSLNGKLASSVKYDDATTSSNCFIQATAVGFRIATTDGKANNENDKYWYMAFADMPTVGSNGTPALACNGSNGVTV